LVYWLYNLQKGKTKMALIRWDDEEDQKKDDLFNTPIKRVSSVQSGSWQPAPSGADAPATMDEEPKINGGIFDQRPQVQGNYIVSEEKAQVDQQKRQQDAQIEAARQQAVARAKAARVLAAQAQEASQVSQPEEKKQQAQPRYVPVKRKEDGGFKGFLKGVGAGIQQGLGAVGDVAIKGGGVIDYYGQRLRGVNDEQASVNSVASADKVRNWLFNKKDLTGRNIVGTRDVEDESERITAGKGSVRDFATLGGKGLQVGIDSTMFLNPARIAAEGAKNAARVAPSIIKGAEFLKSPAAKFAARDAAFFGGLQGTATFQKVYGETGDVEAAFQAAAQDAAIGGVMQGTLDIAGNEVGIAANKTINSLRRADNIPTVDLGKGVNGVENIAEEAVQPVTQPQAVADGIVQPVQDGNVSFQPQNVTSETPQISEVMPTNEELTPVADGVAVNNAEQSPIDSADLAGVTPVNAAESVPAGVTPVADGIARQGDVAPVREETNPVASAVNDVRALQEARAGKSQAEEAATNQQLQNIENATPIVDSVPESVGASAEVINPTPLTREQVVERLMPKLADNSDVKTRIAQAVDMGKDTESPIRDILRDGNVKPRRAERIASQFDKLEKHLMEYNRLEEANQKAYAEGGVDALDEAVSRERSRAAREMGITTRRLMSEIKSLEGSRDKKVALINGISDIIGTRNASVLTSAGLLERNIAQELTANLKLAAKNPIKMAKSTLMNGNVIKDTAKSELSHWKDAPRNPVEALKYVVGNTYRTAMIPTTTLANTRRGAVRDELTRWAFQELEGRKVSASEAHRLSGTAGNEMESLVNTFIGVDNGMSNRKQATDALAAWKEYIRTGDDGAKTKFLEKVEQHNSLADQMISGLSKEDETRARGLMAMKNLIFPFVRTATNLAKNTVRQDLNPMAKSLLDEIRADQRSGGANAVNLIKSKLVDYGIMGGAAALAGSGLLVYNDGDEVDKPRGWALSIGDNKYVPVRSTSLELPMALAGTAQKMAEDIGSGNAREWQYYAKMITGSLPYIDQMNTTTGAVDSLMSGEDAGYAAKAYGVNMTKSFVPFSNNGVQAYMAGKQGESLNAKSVYDENMGNWLYNTVRKSYDPDFYDSLKDSRDNAGRVRTVDNQGVVTNKTINDAGTAEFNDRITDLVEYGREAGLGKATQDMFNSYDKGKNNNFKSVQDSITFLDANGKPDNAKKLEKNPKLNDLAQQIREGFYGETGSELLTLDGKDLKSDVSVPNGAGTKNSKLPLSMQTIKNAIAQTDLPKESSDALFAISGQSTELYNKLKAKSITYEQYSAAKAQLGQQEVDILSGSKNYQKMVDLMDELDQSGFFEADGLGSTRSGQTYLWNSLNALLGSKGATPAANYPEKDKNGFTPWGYGGGRRGTGRGATNKPGDRGNEGIKWSPVGRREMANVATSRYTPFEVKVKLNSAVKKDRTQNYSDRSF
jgi:hypothetical protein